MDAYAAWAPSYPAQPHNALMELEQMHVLSLLPPVERRRVLDAGCGTGRYGRLLTALGANVVGVDLSHAMAARARSEHQLRVVRADLNALPIAAASCDLVVSGLAVMDLPDLETVCAEWSRVLRARGVVVFSALHPNGKACGWRRTFDVDGRTHVLPSHWHTVAESTRACERAGLEIERVAEPALEANELAVALIVRARKRG